MKKLITLLMVLLSIVTIYAVEETVNIQDSTDQLTAIEISSQQTDALMQEMEDLLQENSKSVTVTESEEAQSLVQEEKYQAFSCDTEKEKAKPSYVVQSNKCDTNKPPFDQGYAAKKSDMNKAYSYPARIDPAKGWDVFVKGDYIYWKPYQELMDLALERIESHDGTSDSYSNHKIHHKYTSGFKVGLGKSFNRDDWELYGEYTWLRPENSKTTSIDLVEGSAGWLYNTWIVGANNVSHSMLNNPFDLYYNWKVDFDRGDVELARYFYSGTKLTIRPNLGWTLLRLNENFKLELRSTGYNTAYTHVRSTSFSYGPKLGMNTNYILGYGFSILGHVNAGLMYAKNIVKGDVYSERTTFTELGQDNVRYSNYRKTAIRDFEDFSIGMSWGSYFAKNKANFSISVLYELQRYSNVNYMKQLMSRLMVTIPQTSLTNQQTFYPTDTIAGAYFTHGLTAKVRFDF